MAYMGEIALHCTRLELVRSWLSNSGSLALRATDQNNEFMIQLYLAADQFHALMAALPRAADYHDMDVEAPSSSRMVPA